MGVQADEPGSKLSLGGVFMAYKIVWLRDSFAIGTEQIDGLDEAKARAREHLQRMHADFAVTAVKVVDDRGTALFLDSLGGR